MFGMPEYLQSSRSGGWAWNRARVNSLLEYFGLIFCMIFVCDAYTHWVPAK